MLKFQVVNVAHTPRCQQAVDAQSETQPGATQTGKTNAKCKNLQLVFAAAAAAAVASNANACPADFEVSAPLIGSHTHTTRNTHTQPHTHTHPYIK